MSQHVCGTPPRAAPTDSVRRVNRRLLTILLPLAAATLAAGCTTFSDADAVARVDDTELSASELDELLDAQQIPDEARGDLELVRPVISQWIEQTAVENGLFSAELIDAIPEQQLLALYADGIEAAGVICVRLIVTTSAETAAGVADRLRAGDDFSTIFDEENTDADLATVNGEAGCFDLNQFGGLAEPPPEIAALFTLDATNAVTSSESFNADGSPAGLVLVYRDVDDLPAAEREQVVALIRQTNGVGLVIDDLDIHVASRYGTFDVDSASVVPLG